MEEASEPSEPSLSNLFNQAKTGQDELDSLDPRSAKFKHTLQAIVDNLQRCRQLIRQLAIFSTNEEVEDISTQDLQYAKPFCKVSRALLMQSLGI